MGKPLSTLVSYAVRPVKNYNVMDRAHKYVEVPKVAPKHPSTFSILEEFARDNPQLLEEVRRKDDKLLSHLKDVYVISQKIMPSSEAPEQRNDSPMKRPLPSWRPPSGDQREEEEEKAAAARPTPVGKITLLGAIQLLTENQDHVVNAAHIQAASEKYRLEPEVIRHVLHYYSALQLHMPSDTSRDDKRTERVPTVATPMRPVLEEISRTSAETSEKPEKTSERK